MQFPEQIDYLQNLLDKLAMANSIEDKLAVINEQPSVKEFLSQPTPLITYLRELNPENELALKALLAIGQGPVVFRNLHELEQPKESLQNLLQVLLQMENNYKTIGGIIGYQLALLKRIAIKNNKAPEAPHNIRYIKPVGKDISKDSPSVSQYVKWGIESLPIMGEIYPVGGAGDRLGLVDEKTGKPLPAAKLKFTGRTLLEGLFLDLHVREFLYYQLTGRRIITPVALMTSHEKGNHAHILEICEENKWFGRPKESLRFFIQPLVPVVTVEGNWSTKAPLQLTLKPGGHGLLWKLALEAGIFDWMEAQGRRKLLVRQINNPIAGIDHGLLAFLGVGCKKDKSFGFASCQRLLNAPEGMNAFIEKKVENGFEYCLTNIEYTEFEHKGLQDIPENPNSCFSVFPSNTNILFADLRKVRQIAEKCPIPGLLINMKNKVPYIDKVGKIIQIEGGRLESTMQNIADYIVEEYPQPLKPEEYEDFQSYITFNLRRKTISVTKALYEKGKEMLGTPEGCLYDLLENYEELFRNFCGFHIPALGSKENYLENGPPFFILLHPALGPPFSVIAQKIHTGTIHAGSELQLEIADVQISNLDLQGSLRVLSENIYSEETGKCLLRNVRIINQGINRSETRRYWTNQIIRKEELLIKLSGNGEFIAENIEFNGNHQIDVPHGHRITAVQDGKEVKFHIEKLKSSLRFWHYSFDTQNKIILSRS